MNGWLSLLGCAAVLALCVGCGSKELGPASEDDTPKVSEDEVGDSYTEGMPEEEKERMRKMGYEVK